MNTLDDWHLVYVTVVFLLVLTACAPAAMAYFPKKVQPFSTLAVLGEEGKIGQYFPEEDPNIGIGDTINWTLYIYNHIGETQYFVVKIKLLNSSMQAPNSTLYIPSSAPVVYEVPRLLLHNETWVHRLEWSLLNLTKVGSIIRIDGIRINNSTIQTNIQAVTGSMFRIVLELWVYDVSADEFNFGWKSHEESYGSWNQIWFNTTITK